MSANSPEDLGLPAPSFRPGDDLFVEDDVGTWRCIGCHRSTAEVDEQGHASACPHLERLKDSEPKGDSRRRVIGEWPGLRSAILRDHDLRHNLLEEIVGAYRREYRAARKSVDSWIQVRGATGRAFAALRDHVAELGPKMAELETLTLAARAWWATADRLDGRGGPPRRRKKGAIR